MDGWKLIAKVQYLIGSDEIGSRKLNGTIFQIIRANVWKVKELATS